MNDNPLPGRKRAVLIFFSILILFSFTLLSLQDWEDEDYLSAQEGLCFGVKNIRSGVLKKISQKRVRLKNAMISYLSERSGDERSAGFLDVCENASRIVLLSGNYYIFNLRC